MANAAPSPATGTKAPSTKATPGFGASCGTVFVALLAILLAAPLMVPHIAPALTPETLPPTLLYNAIIGAVSYIDRVLSALTPPNLLIFRSAMGYIHTVELYTIAKLGIADAIKETALSSLSIASAITGEDCYKHSAGSPKGCRSVASRITRLLRSTSTYGVFLEVPAGGEKWVHTPQSRFIVKSHPASMHAVLLNFGDVQFRMMAELPSTVTTGEAAFRRVHGDEFWSWYGKHPEDHAIFDATMQQLGRLGGADAAVARDVPWGTTVDVVVDVGGGHGLQTAALLAANPSLTGVVLDMPHVVARAREVWAAGAPSSVPSASAVLPRLSWVAGDMFDPSTLPGPAREAARLAAQEGPGGRVCTGQVRSAYGYAMRDILHDWPDEDCVRILASVAEYMRGRGGNATGGHCFGADGKAVPSSAFPVAGTAHSVDKVFIIGRVVVPGASFVSSLGSQDADMVMLGAFGSSAGERTTAAYEALFKAAGLRLVKVHTTRSHYAVLEAERA